MKKPIEIPLRFCDMSKLTIFELFISVVGEPQAKTQVVFQAKTQAKIVSIELPPRFQCDEYTPAVLILGKPPFASDALPSLLNAGTKLEKTFRNDVYYKFDAMPDPRANLLKAQVLFGIRHL